ncbi:TPA: hypothetical protein DDY33_00615 [Candidatus Nomurabacteria bacterium]|nr:hypothetical protein [Candidatus Nomurabacteria bacterium]HCT85512.1 hypothetical protein [Candidatus Margulisiibacteriota bacterium]
MYDYDEESCYEPTLADEIMLEYQQKMKDALLDSVKNNIGGVMEENLMLKEEVEKLRKGKYGVQRRERELAAKENMLEREFYRKKFSELLKPLEEKYSGYYAEYYFIPLDKCGYCDDERKIIYTAPNGDTTSNYCSCNKRNKVYRPEYTMINVLNIWKDTGNCKVSISAEYYDKADEDYKWSKLEFKQLISVFNKTTAPDLLSRKALFKSKEECQKYCDWLNSKEVS